MGTCEDRVTKVIWRSLRGHVEAGHKLEVRRTGVDQEIHCCWCGNTVLGGSPRFVQLIVKELKKSGAKITDIRRLIEAA